MNQETTIEHLQDIKPALLNTKGVAKLLGISTRQVWRLLSAGRLPSPVTLGASGRLRRWRRIELLEWINHGCPSADTWSAWWTTIRLQRPDQLSRLD